MPSFHYMAYTADGDQVSGHLDAETKAQALTHIAARGLVAYSTDLVDQKSETVPPGVTLWWSQLSLDDRSELARELVTLIEAGLPLEETLRVVSRQSARRARTSFLTDAQEKIAAGQSLSQAFAAAKPAFPINETAMILAGEKSGSLVQVLQELASSLERRAEIRRQLISALVYPAILLVMALIAIVIITTVLVPNLTPLFEGSGAAMPLVVQAMVATNDVIAKHWPVLLGVIVAFGPITYWALRIPEVRRSLDRFALWCPGISWFAKTAETARVSRTLGALLQSDVQLVEALNIVRQVCRNRVISERIGEVIERVIAGEKLSMVLPDLDLVPDFAQQLIAIGEETNRLAQMNLHIAHKSEDALRIGVERMMTLLTPTLTIGIGVLVGGLIMSVMQAILSLNELAF